MRLPLCCAAVVVALVIAGCGSGSGSSRTSAGNQTTTGSTAPGQRILHYLNREPKPRAPGPHPGARVDHLIVKDVRKGRGPAIQPGDSGIFDFIASNWVTGRPLEAAWEKRRPFETRIEKGVVIEGWSQGIPGMRVGGRRQLIIPPSLGFTTNPQLVRSTVYFDVVLVQINPQQPPGMSGAAPAGGVAATG